MKGDNVSFISDFKAFLDDAGVDYTIKEDNGVFFLFFRYVSAVAAAVPLEFFAGGGNLQDICCAMCSGMKVLYVFEDRWSHSNDLMKAHILSNAGQCKSVFARNCIVKPVSAEDAAKFLSVNHIYGSAKSKYRYGLFRRRRTGRCETDGEAGEMVAVATFSAPRMVTRLMDDGSAVQVNSYEWVRYASITGIRVAGGMGKLLQAFIDDATPEDVMSYADLEWSDGEVYQKLGFKKTGTRAPVLFTVDSDTMERISEQKIGRDRKYSKMGKGEGLPDNRKDNQIRIQNLGSDKYVLSLRKAILL